MVLFALIIAGAVDTARGLSGGLPTTGFARAFVMFSGFMMPVSAQDVPVRGGFGGGIGGGYGFPLFAVCAAKDRVDVFALEPERGRYGGDYWVEWDPFLHGPLCFAFFDFPDFAGC